MDKQYGVTIIELMVAITVLAILATVAIPSYSYMMTSNRMTTQSNQLLTTMLFARSEAAKRGVPVSVCMSNENLDGCDPDSSWNQGWIVYADMVQDGVYVAAQDTMLRASPALDGDITLTPNPVMADITYSPDGRSDASGDFIFCDSSEGSEHSRKLKISPTGRPAVLKQGSCS